MHSDDMLIRPMQRAELDTLVDWAADEGWNPGLDDAEVFWATDPEGFIAAEQDGELIGGGSIVSYAGRYGFMGFFIIRADKRGQGLGNQLWQARKQLLQARLHKPAVIGMDGVFAMQSYYAKGGFQLVCRDLRYAGTAGQQYASVAGGGRLVELQNLPLEQIDAYDQRHFPAPRTHFLRRWIARPGGYALGVMQADELAGYTVLRPCREGYKIGPLFADNALLAEQLLVAILNEIPGQPLFLDVPENNPQAVSLAGQYGMTQVFGCARMILGEPPQLPDHEIFGVTTFELG